MHSKIEKLLSKLEDQEYKANNTKNTTASLKELYHKIKETAPVSRKPVWIVK